MLRTPFAVAMGAAAAYFLDPARGRSRRAMARDRGRAVARRSARRAMRAMRGARADATGALLRAMHRREAPKPQPNDATLAQKVQTVLFRDPDVPHGDILVNAEHGRVVLRGVVGDAALRERIERTVRGVRGVADVESLLHDPSTPAPQHMPAPGRPARIVVGAPSLPR